MHNAMTAEAEFKRVMDEQPQKALELAEDSESIQTDHHGHGAINELQGVDDYRSYVDIRIDEIYLRGSDIAMPRDLFYNAVNVCANPDFCLDELELTYQDSYT